MLSAVAAQETRPNVLFIAIDDLNACLESMNGETTIATPNINRLAQQGTLFTNAHCAAPACNPSRVAVMTGLAPATSGLYLNQQDWRESERLQTVTTLPQHFKNHGYKTLGGGKLYHAASLNPKMFAGYIDTRPWDDYFPAVGTQLAPEVVPDHIPTNGSPDQYRGYMDWAALDIEPAEMGDAKVVSWAEQQLARTHNQPLFLAVGIYRPHIPWYTPRQYFDQHPLDEIEFPEILPNDLDDVPAAGQAMARRHWHEWIASNDKWAEAIQGYNASVSFTDDMVGRLLTALQNGPLAENTVIVLWSDHGYHLGQKETWEKFALWEQTTRVPLIVAAPGKFEVGVSSAAAVSLLDIYPTLNELCGLPTEESLDGTSLVSLMHDPVQATNRAIVITHGRENHAVRSADWRYIRYADGSEELYDQRTDPKNFHNLAVLSDYAAIKSQLANHLPSFDAPIDPVRESPLRKR
ncbi:MAG: sulfatase [Synoicihabitans sp.]